MIKYPYNNVTITANNQLLSGASAWPTLDNNNHVPANLAANQQHSPVTNGWLTAAKQGPTLGRSKKVQGPPSPWTASKSSMVAAEFENEESIEEEEALAPGYKESFFSSIDETLRGIDSSIQIMLYL